MILPGKVEEKGSRGKSKEAEEKMKIAWRYERMGAFEGRERGMRIFFAIHRLELFSFKWCCITLVYVHLTFRC